MICIFCPADDQPALWAYQGLKRRGLVSLEIFTPEALVYNRRLEHRLQDGDTLTSLILADGRALESANFTGALNRISALPQAHFRAAVPADQSYAVQEQQAVFLSWLHGLPGVMINPPGPRGLCGDLRSPAEWAWLAARAGLPVLPFYQSDLTPGDAFGRPPGVTAGFQAIVLDGQIFSLHAARIPHTFKSGMARLADLSGLRLLGVEFCDGPGGETLFARASPLPDLRLGGEALLDALAAALLGTHT